MTLISISLLFSPYIFLVSSICGTRHSTIQFPFISFVFCLPSIGLSSSLFLFVGFSIIIPKLKDLVPVLVNCFQDFIPAVQTGSHLDVQSYDCMLLILHSIKHAVQFFVYMTDEGMSESRPSHGELDVAMLGGTISIMLMKKLLVLFPLSMRNQLSEKVNNK